MTTPDDPGARSGVGHENDVRRPLDDARGVVYRGGPIVTVDPGRPRPAAVATRAGRIVAVGSEEDCRRAVGLAPDGDDDSPDRHLDGPVVVDLAGRALLPGFVDAHLLPLALCMGAYYGDLSAARSITDVLDTLAEQARSRERADWVVGLNLRPELLDEQRLPTAAELDKIADGQVVVVVARDGRRSSGNSIALRVAGIRNNSPDPPGGAYRRDHQSRLTGECDERATCVLLTMLPIPDHETLRPLLRQVGRDLVARGITSAGLSLQTDDDGHTGRALAHEAHTLMLLVDELPVGCHAILSGHPYRAIDARTASSLHDPGHNRTVTGISLMLDGSFEGRGAWLREAYADRPGHRGWLTYRIDDAADRIDTAHREGLQVCLHAVGDAAVARALHLFAQLRERHPDDGRGPRHRVEQAALVDDATLDRFAELGVAAVLRPNLARSQAGWLTSRLGPARAERAHPFRRLVDAGVLVAAASDAPIGDLDVLASIAHTPLTADEAVALHTHNAAAALQQDHEVGVLREGYRADLVMLSTDPTSVPNDRIADIAVCQTLVGGKVVTPTR